VSEEPLPESEPPRAGSGDEVGLGVLLAGVAAIPSTLRAAGRGAPALDAWLVATAAWALLLVPVSLAMPRAARGLRGLVGRAAPREWLLGLGLAASLGAAGLVVLASVLHAKTHHRGLGGGVFGIVGGAVLVGAALAAGRLVVIGRELAARGVRREILAVVPAGAALAAVALLGSPLARRATDGAPLRAAMWDLLLGVGLVALSRLVRLSDGASPALRLGGVPAFAFVVVAGGLRVETSTAGPALVEGGGLPGAALSALGAWSDRDGDGHAAHFGGRDCDEGDPRRHPGAHDAPGDGVDADCDGQDPAREAAGSGVPSATAASARPSGSPAASASAREDAAAPSSAAAPDAPASDPAGSREARPDLIVVTLDTVRADRTSLHGYAKKTTPTLDELATSGVVFDHAYAAAADTQRALVPVVSGRSLRETPHAGGEWPVLDDKPEMLAERLAKAGYRTGAVTSFTWLRKDRGFAQGFELFDESPFRENHPERKVTGARAIDAAIAAHRELASGDKPLYLWVHLFDAHARYLPHDGLSFGTGEAGLYAGEIAYVDRELGRLVAAVREGPRGKRTVFVVHGSHGEAFGEHGAKGHGTQLFDEVLHVPMLIAGDAMSPRHIETAVSVYDVAATVADLARADASGLSGVSLVPALRGEALSRPPVVAHSTRRVAVIDWPLKLLSFRQKSGKLNLALYELAADPGEKNDLSKTRTDDKNRLDALRKRADDNREEEDRRR